MLIICHHIQIQMLKFVEKVLKYSDWFTLKEPLALKAKTKFGKTENFGLKNWPLHNNWHVHCLL